MDDRGDDIFAEIVARPLGIGVLDELLVEKIGIEDIDPHGHERSISATGHRLRVIGFFLEAHDPEMVIDGHDPEAARLAQGDLNATDREVGLVLEMEGQHRPVVHLVDMVAGQDQHVSRLVGSEDIDVLIQGVRGSPIPGLMDALGGGKDLDEFSELLVQKTPAALQMTDEGVGLVLRQHPDAPDAGIHAIGQGKINDPELAAEGYRGLCAPASQVPQPIAAPAGQDQGQCGARQAADESRAVL